jgi:hypothetical protein
VLFDCTVCHVVSDPKGGPGHAERPACATCHSEAAHPEGAACSGCHDPHGSDNAFLLRPTLDTPGGAKDISVTRPEGASAEGLVRAGVPGAVPGTGVCEVCHTQTLHYNNSGTGLDHEAAWCPQCHSHQDGFPP